MLASFLRQHGPANGQGSGRSPVERKREALVDARTKLGWTSLMMAQGIFFANAKKEYPVAAAILKQAGAH